MAIGECGGYQYASGFARRLNQIGLHNFYHIIIAPPRHFAAERVAGCYKIRPGLRDNFDDGGALMAFRVRRADGSVLYAGGSVRRAGESAVRNFAPGEVAFEPQRQWESPASRAHYPVQWRVTTPAGRFTVQALLDDQELDSRNSTGAIYWEGLSELLDASGARVGLGYLELTGYAAALRL